MTRLKGKVAVVTGGSRGIGKAIVTRLARDGAMVVVNYRRTGREAAETVTQIEAAGGAAVAVQADVADVSQISGLFQTAEEHFGGLDILVNNAGIALFKPFSDITQADFDAIFALNSRGTFFAMQEASRRMRNGGRIISISTAGTQRASAGSSVYGGSKICAEFFSRVLAKEIGSRQITVNVVSPGPTETDMLAENPQFKAIGLQLSPLQRLGRPDDIASVVAFLASEEGGWITGQVIQAAGGIS